MMKIIMTTLFISLTITISYGQNPRFVDSLKNVLANYVSNDTNKVNVLTELSNFYKWSNPDSAILYGNQALALSEKLNINNPKSEIYGAMQEALSMKGNFPKALEMGFNRLEIAKKLGNKYLIFWSFNSIGSTYFYARDYQKALNYFLLGKHYLNDSKESLKLHLGFIGETYFHLNQIDSALFFTRKAYDIDITSNTHWAVPYFYSGDIQLKKGNYKQALTYYHQGLTLSTEALDWVNGQNRIAAVLKKTGLPDSAIYHSTLALKKAESIHYKQGILDACMELSDSYVPINIRESFRYFKMAATTKDSLFGTDNLQAMHALMTQEENRQKIIENQRIENQNKLKLYTTLVCLGVMMLIGFILYRNNRQKHKMNVLLQEQKDKVEKTLSTLQSTQAQLIQSEKLASLGELTAGIAHEIQNPLNFVNNFAEVSAEMIGEMKEEIKAGNTSEVIAIADDLEQNLSKIKHHGQRASSIVKGMLEHSRASTGVKEPTDLNALVDEYLRLAYHGWRAKDNNFNATMETHFDPDLPKVSVIPQDIGRVLLNLINNAFYALDEKQKQSAKVASGAPLSESFRLSESYTPTISLRTKRLDNAVEISIKDNGPGIPESIRDKIFQPFFTTKPTGQGTGLGLSLAYDIVTKGHGGVLDVQSQNGAGSIFIISLPFNRI